MDELLVRIRPQRAAEHFDSIATAARAAAMTPGDSEAGEASPRGTVLVVDDSTDNRRLIVHFLRSAGWTITTAEHGAKPSIECSPGTCTTSS
jgi:PleD family two-component response regulator